MYWTYGHIAGIEFGTGEKWGLYAADRDETLLATIIRLPGTKTRIFWPRGEVLYEDFSTVYDAFLRVRTVFGEIVPPLAGRSDLWQRTGRYTTEEVVAS